MVRSQNGEEDLNIARISSSFFGVCRCPEPLWVPVLHREDMSNGYWQIHGETAGVYPLDVWAGVTLGNEEDQWAKEDHLEISTSFWTPTFSATLSWDYWFGGHHRQCSLERPSALGKRLQAIWEGPGFAVLGGNGRVLRSRASVVEELSLVSGNPSFWVQLSSRFLWWGLGLG
jgi:hypothetical protein